MSDELKLWISDRVLASRNHAGLTQERLAELIGRSVEAISNIERGVSLPTIDTLDKIAETVGVSFGFFFEGMRVDKPKNSEAIFQLILMVRSLQERDADLLVQLAKSMTDT